MRILTSFSSTSKRGNTKKFCETYCTHKKSLLSSYLEIENVSFPRTDLQRANEIEIPNKCLGGTCNLQKASPVCLIKSDSSFRTNSNSISSSDNFPFPPSRYTCWPHPLSQKHTALSMRELHLDSNWVPIVRDFPIHLVTPTTIALHTGDTNK